MILACACLTGSYENHTANSPCNYGGGDSNVAEAFFARGAVAYIGSTEVSAKSSNVLAGLEFIPQYWKQHIPAGLALLNFKKKFLVGGNVQFGDQYSGF